MSETSETGTLTRPGTTHNFWPMTLLALVFLSSYLAALLGWLRPSPEVIAILRLEPLLCLLFGYSFGRSLGRTHRRRDREDRERLERKLETTSLQRDRIQAEREVIEERLRNAKAALSSAHASEIQTVKNGSESRELSPAVETAIRILDS